MQPSHDFTVYAATATAALASGVMHATAGWAVINYTTLPLMLSIVLAALWLMVKQQTVRAQAQET